MGAGADAPSVAEATNDTGAAVAADEAEAVGDSDAVKEEPPKTLGPEVIQPSYKLVAHTEDPYPVGEVGKFSIELVGRGKWHVNTEYPLGMKLEGQGAVELPKKQYAQGDAAAFKAEVARFEVPFTLQAEGNAEVLAEVDFAVCSEDNCLPATETLKVALAAH